MQNLGYTYTKILSAVYLIFKLDWTSCIFLCQIWQLYTEAGEWTYASLVWSLLSLCWPPVPSLAHPQMIFPSSCLHLKTCHGLPLSGHCHASCFLPLFPDSLVSSCSFVITFGWASSLPATLKLIGGYLRHSYTLIYPHHVCLISTFQIDLRDRGEKRLPYSLSLT